MLIAFNFKKLLVSLCHKNTKFHLVLRFKSNQNQIIYLDKQIQKKR